MKIQEIVISDRNYPSLYYRGGTFDCGRILLKRGERLSFDTYFGSFTYSKYRDYTALTSIDFIGRISGTAKAMLCCFDGESENVVAEADTEGFFSLRAEFSALPKKGILYPVIEAKSDAEFLGGEYSADIMKNKVSMAIAFCTFRREEYLKKNIELLERENISGIDKVIVVDNGNTLSESDFSWDKVKLCKNPNYGGSAGFTRGIIEAKAENYTHVILMDDDIEIFPEALERMIVFASILREEYKGAHFSAAMLKASKLYIQHEKGALWNGTHIESLNTELDVRERDALIANLDDGPIGYGAWWCFCLPLSDVDKFGLPLPLFIKFDDVEYGTRCCRNVPIITMSGMAVSHADFDGKYNMHLEYYTIRNQLIMLAVHKMQNRIGCILRLIKVSAKHLFLYRYDAQPILLRAFEDFLRGADFIINTNAEKLNRSVMAMTPKAIDLSELPDWDASIKEKYKSKKVSIINRAFRLILLGGHLIPNVFMKKETVYMPLPVAKNSDNFMRKNTVQYQMLGNSGYVFNKHSGKFFACFFRCICMAFKILFGYGKASGSYRKNKEYLMSDEFWHKYLELDNL